MKKSQNSFHNHPHPNPKGTDIGKTINPKKIIVNTGLHGEEGNKLDDMLIGFPKPFFPAEVLDMIIGVRKIKLTLYKMSGLIVLH